MTLKPLLTSFEGRINRQTFWIAVVSMFVIGIVLYLILGAIASILALLVAVALIYPQFAIAAKRLHDMGKTGWLSLILLIPIVGLIFLIWMGVTASDPGSNEFGAPQSGPLEYKW